jgi:hypothetical protein
MAIYIICGVILVILFVMTTFFKKKSSSNTQPENTETISRGENFSNSENSVCCGKHAVCEKDRLTEAMMNKANYFEDEDLDRYKGKSSSDYVDSEIEEFRYVLYTMEQNEVSEWLESLQVRGIELPNALKEEAFSLMTETD